MCGTRPWAAPGASAPTAPSGLRAELNGHGEGLLAWNPATDPESGVPGYVVYRDEQQMAFVRGTEYRDRGAGAGTTHLYRVASVNGAGLWSGTSAQADLSFPADAGVAAILAPLGEPLPLHDE